MAGKIPSPRRTKAAARAEAAAQTAQAALSIALKLDAHGRGGLGPGKIRLLELIDEKGSISAAGRSIPMSYRRAWMIVESLNQMFPDPIVLGQHGGSHGGGAALTPHGRRLIQCYRTMQRKAETALAAELREMELLLKGAP